jgi:hypothetical protein
MDLEVVFNCFVVEDFTLFNSACIFFGAKEFTPTKRLEKRTLILNNRMRILGLKVINLQQCSIAITT